MLKKSSLFLSIVLSQSFAHAAHPLPKDVSTYIDRRATCYHMAGEIPDPSEKQRLREVIREINKQCKGLDTSKLQMEKKYASNRIVAARLSKLAADTDAAPVPAQPAPAQ